MSEQTPPPWAWAIAGGAILWLLKLLKDVVFRWKSSESKEDQEFRARVVADIAALKETVAGIDKRVAIIEALEGRAEK